MLRCAAYNKRSGIFTNMAGSQHLLWLTAKGVKAAEKLVAAYGGQPAFGGQPACGGQPAHEGPPAHGSPPAYAEQPGSSTPNSPSTEKTPAPATPSPQVNKKRPRQASPDITPKRAKVKASGEQNRGNCTNAGEDDKGETSMGRTPVGVARKLFQEEVKGELSEAVRGAVKEEPRAVNWAHVAATERGVHVKQEDVHNEGRIRVKEEFEVNIDWARIAAWKGSRSPQIREISQRDNAACQLR